MKQKNLEKLITETKNYVVDTSASLLFYNPIFGLNELYVSNMEPEEVIKTRVSMSVFQLFAARPYSKFREYCAKLLKVDKNSSKTKKLACDIGSNLAFYTPIYAGLLAASGASKEEIMVSLPAGMLTAIVLGRPYGWFLDKWRKLYGCKPTLEK